MNKKDIINQLLEIANDFDTQGFFNYANSLTDVGRRLAQYSEADALEEMYEYSYQQLMDEGEDEEEEWQSNPFESFESVLEYIKSVQATGTNIPFLIISDTNGNFYSARRHQYDSDDSDYKVETLIEPMTDVEKSSYIYQQNMPEYDLDTPYGIELDDTPDPMLDY
jgi:hypothetical protein